MDFLLVLFLIYLLSQTKHFISIILIAFVIVATLALMIFWLIQKSTIVTHICIYPAAVGTVYPVDA